MTLGPVDQVWFWVTDMDRAVDFYQEALGLELRMRHEDTWAEFEAGGIRVGLHGVGSEHDMEHRGTVVFSVDDLDLAKAALEQKGVAFEDHLGEVPGYARYASFVDPDGNAMQLIEYVRPGDRGAEGASADARAVTPRGGES